MLFEEIVKTAARLLGREDAAAYFDDPSAADASVKKEAELIARCVNLSIAQTAAEYVPFKAEEVVDAPNGTVAFSSLKHNAADIVSAEDLSGNRLKIKYYPEYFRTVPGAVRVVYTYLPEKFVPGDEVNFSDRRVSAALVAYGAAAEYCLAAGLFDEAVVWNDRYLESVRKTVVTKNKIIGGRAWV